jgi:nanoRNase/pAp phosphatase (c-di-AMP/oligoRNAs hydrolase)
MYTVPIVNTNALISEVTHELAKNEPFAASWYLRADGRVRWSLRSTEDGIDVSKLALTLGGGGHKHAAGFHTDKLEAING